jgi:chromate transporter
MVAIAVAAFIGIYVFSIPFPLIILCAGLAGWIGSRLAPGLFVEGGHGSKGGAADIKGVIDLMFERGELAHADPSWARAFRVLIIWLPIWLAPVFLLWVLTGPSVWTQIGSFFSAMAVVTFGGAYAVLAYVAQAAVETFGWLAPGEMMDGLGLAETTPGPLVMVLQFVGFLAAFRAPGSLDPLLAGCLGALLTTWVTFAPCFLWIFLGAPYVEALRSNRAISAALSAITAAVVGVVMNLALWFALHVVFREVRVVEFLGIGVDLPAPGSINWPAAILAVAAMVAMLRFRIGMLPTLACCALAGVALRHLVG